MIDVEPVIHDELERLSPEAEAGRPDWQDVIRRAKPAPTVLTRRRRPWTRSAAAAVALASVMAALALVSPWDGGPTLVDRALAAVGDQPVLHAVIARPSPRTDERLIGVESGATIERVETTEIWFDRSRDLKKTVTALDGHVLDELLETAAGGFTRGGPVYTCAWIAAHPVEATRAGVSCNLSGENGTVPRHIPERPPTLDEALAGFVDRYQSGLASGRVREVGSGELGGREVIWLELPPGTGAAPAPHRDRVAIDADTYKPVLVEAADGAIRFRVLTIETVPFARSLFTSPEPLGPAPGGVGGSVRASAEISPSQASAALGKPALWLGEEWNGYRLVETKRVDLSIGYGPRSEREPTQTTGVEFEYARIATDGSVDRDATFTLRETTICTIHWGWRCGPQDPPPGLMLTGLLPRSLVRTEDLYIAVWNLNQLAEPASVELARALRPVASG